MKKINSRLVFIILAVSFVFLAAAGFSSCGKNDDKDREVFAPESGAYEIKLSPDDWSEVMISMVDAPDQLGLLNGTLSFILTVDGYKKSDLAVLEISDINSFINFYKTFDSPKNMYTPTDTKTIGELKDISKKEIKGSAAKSGKLQEIYVKGTEFDAVSEFIYLESENHFFALSYLSFADKYAEAQTSVRDLITHLKIAGEK